MLILFLLQLKSGQNPYQILGIPKNSDDQQIKTAYHKLARKYHPDISKEKDAERKFIDATDAYELLKDKRRRQIYDQTGSVSEIPDEAEQQRRFQQFQQFQNFQRHFFNVKFTTPIVDENSIDSVLGDSTDCLVMIYSSRYMHACIDFVYFYEEIANHYKYIIKFMRNDASKSRTFMKTSGVNSIPNVVYVHRNSKGTLSYSKMDINSVHDKSSFLSWMIQCWDFYITRINSIIQAKKWLKKNPGLTHILSVSYEREPAIEMKRIATVYGYNCKFAILTVNSSQIKELSQINISNIPEYHIYRREGDKVLDDLSIELKNYANPQFSRLNTKSQFLECRNFCLVYIGNPTSYQINRYISIIDEPIVYIDNNSTFAKKLKLKKTQWILFEGLKRRYSVVQDKENIRNEIAKYKSNTLLMKNLPSDVRIDFYFSDELNDMSEYFDKNIQKLIDYPYKETLNQLSIEFVVTGFLIILIFLFCCC